jgi:hypothetical protein
MRVPTGARSNASGSEEVAGLASLGAVFVAPLPSTSNELIDLAEHLNETIGAMAAAKQRAVLERASALLAQQPTE